MMIILLAASLVLFVLSLFQLSPSEVTATVGYGDIGGYRNGSWLELLAFPLLALIFGVFHNVIAVRLYAKRGADQTKAFLGVSLALVALAGLTMLRVAGIM